jgi:hypothetical protein
MPRTGRHCCRARIAGLRRERHFCRQRLLEIGAEIITTGRPTASCRPAACRRPSDIRRKVAGVLPRGRCLRPIARWLLPPGGRARPRLERSRSTGRGRSAHKRARRWPAQAMSTSPIRCESAERVVEHDLVEIMTAGQVDNRPGGNAGGLHLDETGSARASGSSLVLVRCAAARS